MSEEEWTAKMASCKNYAIKETENMSQDEEIKAFTGLYFLSYGVIQSISF